MAVIKELIRKEDDGTLSFGNYEFDTKQKLSDFEFEGDLYKVKTFKEITKLERKMKTNLGGKLVLSIEINPGQTYQIRVVTL